MDGDKLNMEHGKFRKGRCLAHNGHMHNDASRPKCGGEDDFNGEETWAASIQRLAFQETGHAGLNALRLPLQTQPLKHDL